ncbi:MAG: outer membrane beta-barrel protein [Longimicrobiales bacterium]|nr:outer membrane beta-barrel protein [Longimicrobiales bacterium]
MHRFMSALSALFVLAIQASPSEAQIKLGAQAGIITSIDAIEADAGGSLESGTLGLGARAMIDPPLLPLGGFVSGTYYFPGDGLTYWTATAAAQLRLPLPVVKPYAVAGWQINRSSIETVDGDLSTTENGPVIGLGVQFDFMVSLFLEGTFEFDALGDIGGTDLDTDPIVIKGGVLFGG